MFLLWIMNVKKHFTTYVFVERSIFGYRGEIELALCSGSGLRKSTIRQRKPDAYAEQALWMTRNKTQAPARYHLSGLM